MLNYTAALVALASVAAATKPGDPGFIDGCTDTRTGSAISDETYDQC